METKDEPDEPERSFVIFQQFDQDQNGTISSHEFQDLAYACDIPLTDEAATDTFHSIAVSNPEGITLSEFQTWINGESSISAAPVSQLLRARLLANTLGRSLRQATEESTFWKHGDDRVNTVSLNVKVGTMPSNIQPMELNVSIRPADLSLKNPKISIVFNIEDEVTDFSLGTAIGTLQTLMDAALAALGPVGTVPISVKIADPINNKMIIDIVVNDIHKLPQGPPVNINIVDILSSFEISFKLSQCLETLASINSKSVVFGDTFALEVATNIAIVKKGLRLLKRLKIHFDQLHGMQWDSSVQALMATTVPFLFPIMLDVMHCEIEFENVLELFNALIKNDRGLNIDRSLIEWIKQIKGWHVATFLQLPPRTGLAKEMPNPAKKLYDVMKNTFSGLDSIIMDMGQYNTEGNGIHGGSIHFKCINFNPMRILPELEAQEYPKHFNDGTPILDYKREYKRICDEWFATFTDPVLRTWAALVQNKPLPKDFQVKSTIDQIMQAPDSISLIASMELLRDLVKEGALVDQLNLMKHVKQKRAQVGDSIWNTNVAKSFGQVLQAVKGAPGK